MQIIEIRENQKKYKFGGSETNMWLYVADGLRVKRVMSMAVVSTKDITQVGEAGRAYVCRTAPHTEGGAGASRGAARQQPAVRVP